MKNNSQFIIAVCVSLVIGIVIGAIILLCIILSKQDGEIKFIDVGSISLFLSAFAILVTIVLAISTINESLSSSELKNAIKDIENNKRELDEVITSHESSLLQTMDIQIVLASMSKDIALKNRVTLDKARLYYKLAHLSREDKLPLIVYISSQGEISDINQLKYMKSKCVDEVERRVLDDAISSLRKKYQV